MRWLWCIVTHRNSWEQVGSEYRPDWNSVVCWRCAACGRTWIEEKWSAHHGN